MLLSAAACGMGGNLTTPDCVFLGTFSCSLLRGIFQDQALPATQIVTFLHRAVHSSFLVQRDSPLIRRALAGGTVIA
jgi:hypothetical protein